MTAPEIIDQLCWLAELGVTMSSVPIPPVKDVNAYLDYAQWLIEEIKPKVPWPKGRAAQIHPPPKAVEIAASL